MNNYARTNNIGEAFCKLRQFRADLIRITSKYNEDRAKLEPYKGSKVYSERMDALESEYNATIRERRFTAKSDLDIAFAGARGTVEGRLGAAPTTEMVNALTTLEKLETPSVRMIRVNADKMKNCPMAINWLRSIATKHGVYISSEDPEVQLERLDRFELTVRQYIDSFNGLDNPDGILATSIRFLDCVLVPNAPASAETAYLSHQFDIADITHYDATHKPAPINTYFVFSGTKELSDYINHRTEGLEGDARTAVENFVLNNCPDNYGAAYRNYLATGEVTTF